MTDDELKAIEARANAATPGDWHAISTVPDVWLIEHIAGHLRAYQGADAVFVAAARSDVPTLLDEVRRLRGLVKQVEQVDNDFGTLFCPWCGLGPEHKPSCPAFTPDGDVR
jgi:hypothetical protein